MSDLTIIRGVLVEASKLKHIEISDFEGILDCRTVHTCMDGKYFVVGKVIEETRKCIVDLEEVSIPNQERIDKNIKEGLRKLAVINHQAVKISNYIVEYIMYD